MTELDIQSKIEKMIYTLRGHKVMLDTDLAELYGVEVKRLNEQVKRNIDRFPSDFMFQCNSSELEALRSQIATAKQSNVWNYKRRALPFLFTENGVAMLSSVLSSQQAIKMLVPVERSASFFCQERFQFDSQHSSPLLSSCPCLRG